MKRIIGIFLSILLLANLAACSAKPKTEESVKTNNEANLTVEAAEEEKVAADKLSAYFNELHEKKFFSGAVLVANNGHVIFNEVYGKADYGKNIEITPTTKFYLESLTRQFTAAAILQLEDKGLLSVDDNVGKYIPDFEHGDKITIHQLLNNSSGLPEIGTFPWHEFKPSVKKDLKEFKAKDEHITLMFEPGVDFLYESGSFGYTLLGIIVEVVSGKSLDLYLAENIFDPLGMENTGFHDEKRYIDNQAKGYIDSAANEVDSSKYTGDYLVNGQGGLYSTTEDLYKWSVGLQGGKVLSQKTMTKMFTPNYDDYGYGLYVYENDDGSKVCAHPGQGDGFHNQIIMVGTDVCIVVLSNFQEIYMDAITEQLKEII